MLVSPTTGRCPIEKVAQEYHVTITDVVVHPEYIAPAGVPESWFVGKSYLIGREIVLGRYEDEDLRCASFFHEMGHLLMDDGFASSVEYRKRYIEREAWKAGFKLAATCGYVFPDYVRQWAEKQVESYGLN